MLYEIWSEGYGLMEVEGGDQKAWLFGKVEADSFKEACIKFFSTCKEPQYFNAENLTYWCCGLFDNETEARTYMG